MTTNGLSYEADVPHGENRHYRDDPDWLRLGLRCGDDLYAAAGPHHEAFTQLSDNKYVILMCINIMLLLLGTLMDMAPLILILTPVLLPVTNALGIDPVHFGMIMLVNLGIGLITPPVGSVLFVASAVSKQKIEQVVKAMLPFYAILFVVLLLVTYIPAISLFLPKLFGVM